MRAPRRCAECGKAGVPLIVVYLTELERDLACEPCAVKLGWRLESKAKPAAASEARS